MPLVSSSTPAASGGRGPISPSARRSSTRKNTTNPHTRAMADTAPSTTRRNCPVSPARGGTGRFGMAVTGSGRRQNSRPVSSAAAQCSRYSQAPVRALPNTDTPATPMAKAGPALLQNVSSRAPSAGDSSPRRTSSAAVRAPTG